MALKKVVDTTKNTYLTKRFEDDEGNQYGDAAVKSLIAWYRFTDTPSNLVSTGPSIEYEGDTRNAGAFVTGQKYRIASAGSTNFTLVGASNNSVGTVFAATGAGSGSGNAVEIPAVSTQKIGEVEYPVAKFDDTINVSAKSTSSKFSFSTLASGGTPTTSPVTDLPCTFSLWAKFDNLHNLQYLFSKAEDPSSTVEDEYRVSIGEDGDMAWILRDVSSGSNNQIAYMLPNGSVTPGIWTHWAFTYDGRGGASGRGAQGLSLIHI